MSNKKVLIKAVKELNKAKAPAKQKDIVTDPMGQWKYPGQVTRIPSDVITMQGVNYPVWAQPSVGPGTMMMPGQDYDFPGADYVDEYPQMRKGGMLKLPKMPKPSKKGVLGKAYSKSLDATNRLFTENKLFEKPKSKKRKIFDPNAKYQDGGATSPEEWGAEIRAIEEQIGSPDQWSLEGYNLLQNKLDEYRDWRENTPEGQAVMDSHNVEGEYNVPVPEHLQDYTNAMMKSRLAYANEFGNHAAKRMVNIPDNPYQFEDGNTGTHYMSSMDNYAVPQIQEENGQLVYGDYDPESNEAIRFENDADAQYFGRNYKSVSPGFIEAELTPEEIQSYRDGGYVVEDISVPQLTQAQRGITISDPKEYAYRKAAYDDSLYLYKNNSQPLSRINSNIVSDNIKDKPKPYRSQSSTAKYTGKPVESIAYGANDEYRNLPIYVDNVKKYQGTSPAFINYNKSKNFTKQIPTNKPVKIDKRVEYYHPQSITNPFTGKTTGLFYPGQNEQNAALKEVYKAARFKKPVQPVYFADNKTKDKPVNKTVKNTPAAPVKVKSDSFSPIYVTNPLDPRLTAYDDSLRLYNNYATADANFKKRGDKKNAVTKPGRPGEYEYVHKEISPNVIVSQSEKNPDFHPTIKPTGRVSYDLKKPRVYKNGTLNGVPYEGLTETRDYINVFKKPVQPVIYKKSEEQVSADVPEKLQSRSINSLPQNAELAKIPVKSAPQKRNFVASGPRKTFSTMEWDANKQDFVETKRANRSTTVGDGSASQEYLVDGKPISAEKLAELNAISARAKQRPQLTPAQMEEMQLMSTQFAYGGNIYQDGGAKAYYSYGNNGSKYIKDSKGNWLIKNENTDNKYVPIKDPTGKRAAELNKNAKYNKALSADQVVQNKFNYLQKKLNRLHSLNNGLGPSDMSDIFEARRIAEELGELETQYKGKLQSTPILDKANAIGTMALVAGKYVAPKPIQKGLDVLLNVQDINEYIADPSDKLNQAGVASDALSGLQSRRSNMKPFSYAGDLITMVQKAQQFQNANNQNYIVKQAYGGNIYQGGGQLGSGMLAQQIRQSKNAPKKPLVVDNPRLGPTKQSNQGNTAAITPNNKLPQTLNTVRDPEAERRALDRQVRELVQSGAASRSLDTLGSSDKSLYEQTKDALLNDPNFLNKVEKNEYKYQQELEQKAYDDASYLQRGVNLGTAFLSNPITTGANLLEGYRPLMNQAEVLRDPSNPQNVLMRNTGGLDDVFNMFNPGSYVANYNSNVKKGDYSSAALDAADILLAPTGLGRADNATDLTSAFRSLADDGKKLGVKAGSYFPEYKNVYRVEPTTFVKDADDQLSGRWMGELDQMPFYVKNLKDPEGGVRIMRQKMPVKKWQSMSGHNMPFNAKMMSAGTGDYKTLNNAVTAGELSPGAAKRLSVDSPLQSDWEEITFNPKLINLSEGIVPERLANKLRTQKPNRFLSSRDLIEYPAGDLGREGAINHLLNIRGDVEKPILGVPRKYFPFAQGGEYVDAELTPEEIEEYKAKGYIVEELY